VLYIENMQSQAIEFITAFY